MKKDRGRSWPRIALHLATSVVLLSVVLVGATTHSAAAQTITAKTLQVNQCDPALGAVESIEFTVTGELNWEASGESLDPNAVTLTHTLLVVYTYGPGPFHTANAGTNGTFAVTLGFDGVEDFGGNSGFADGGTIPLVHTFVISGASVAPFIGTGTASLALSETATQSVTSTGVNLVESIGNFSALQAATSCTHTPPVTPTTVPPTTVPTTVVPSTPTPAPTTAVPSTPVPATPTPRAAPASTSVPTSVPTLAPTVAPTTAPTATAVALIVPTPAPTPLKIKEPPVFGDPSTRGDSVPPTFGGTVPSGPEALAHGPAAAPSLALTGSTTVLTFLGALVLLCVGGLAVLAGRKRTT